MIDKTAAPKIKDVARLAGVSTATVSRALSKPDSVAKQTRSAVLQAARETGYRINQAARNLRQQKTGAVVVLVPNLGNPFFSQILAGIESTLSKIDLSVVMVDTKQSQDSRGLLTEYLHYSRADGIISLDGSLPMELMEGIQVGNLPIVFGCEWHHEDTYPVARVNNRHGAALAIKHLLDLGHRKIGYASGPTENVLTIARMEGVQRAMQEQQFHLEQQWIFQGDFSLKSGALVANDWLAQKNRPTAIFCASDEMAIGIMSELKKHGVEVPRDISIIGFDDIDVAQYFNPPLSTISQPRFELGVVAAKLLIERLKSNSVAGTEEKTVLPVELVIRDSTARIET